MDRTISSTACRTGTRRSSSSTSCHMSWIYPGQKPGNGKSRSRAPRGNALPRRSASRQRRPFDAERLASGFPRGAWEPGFGFLILIEESNPEAEDAVAVGSGLDDRKTEVQCDRDRPEHRNDDPHADAGRDAVIVDVDAALDRAGIDESDQIEMIVRKNRQLIFEAIEKHEGAADFEAVDVRSDAAELEAAHAAEAAGVEPLEDRRVAAGPGDLAAGGDHVLAAAVGTRERG